LKAVLFESTRRHESFRRKLEEFGVSCTCLSFASTGWIDHDYGDTDLVIFYPEFWYSSNHPQALWTVKDNLAHVHARNPRALIYPDPGLMRYYNDKYRQFLFLSAAGFPIPDTIPLLSEQTVEQAAAELGFPLVVKNRFGAGGDAVFRVEDAGELHKLYRVSRWDYWSPGGFAWLARQLARRDFYYHLIRARKAAFPFLSWPLMAQRYIETDRDLKTVVGRGKVVEAHWRIKADAGMWKVNIDGGGIGEWSHVPDAAIDLSERVAAELGCRWLNLDLMPQDDGFLITEFSPVWHHYKYKEKPSFVYKDDYNIQPPLEEALDLETLIVRSLVEEASAEGEGR
jgi:hypothetical protein